jgi:chemotaxis family two-component system sensor kinase Cph1
MNGFLALSECPAGVTAVTTLGALLSRISRSTQVCFGPHLRNVCDDLSATWGRAGGPELRCVTADCLLPIGAAVTLGLIADLLITNAFVYAFPPGLHGLIAVSFAAGTEAWRLTVDHSGIAIPGGGDGRDHGLMIARLLVLQLDGRLEITAVDEGTRCLVTVPRPPPMVNGARSKDPALPLIQVSAAWRPRCYGAGLTF